MAREIEQCDDCGQPVGAAVFPNGGRWARDTLAKQSRYRFRQTYCWGCYQAHEEAGDAPSSEFSKRLDKR